MGEAGAVFTVPPHPGASSEAISRRMSQLARRDNASELAIRRLLFAQGFRYRVALPVPGRPRRSIDIAFPGAHVAVFVDGCYWHSCPLHGTQPTSNSEWWRSKLAANRARDIDTTQHLEAIGWIVVRVWEHDAPAAAAEQVSAAVAASRSRTTGHER